MDRAYNYFEQSRSSVKYYPMLARELVKEGLYFSAVPYMKEFLLSSRRIYGQEINNLLETIIAEVGTRQFEVLDRRILEKSDAPSIRYILAKKLFRQKKYESALNLLKTNISMVNAISPFALMLKGSIQSILKRPSDAITSFKICVDYADYWIGEFDRDWRKRQLAITRDYCKINISRTEFSSERYEEAKSNYLDISKRFICMA
jgi:tetratricopeptide (TPR) repeat protein